MKISKLFHWLYAFLMFLPVFAVMICCGYVVFNKNAKESYYGETINESILENTEIQYAQQNIEYTLYTNEIIKPFDGGLYTTFYADNIKYNGQDREGYNQISIYRESSGSMRYILSLSGNNQTVLYSNFGDSNVILTFDFVSLVRHEVDISLNYYSYNQYSYLSEVFYYSLNDVYNSPVFSWAKSSFLALPITYITSLFGMASTNVVNYYLSYWLAISIVYLVFDLVMYVPLLVHRWLDKGMIE